MKLKALVLENFRAYRNHTVIEFDELTAFVGKNDFGKSTILEALEIFFNNDVVQIEKLDPSVGSDSKQVRIGCVFENLPDVLVLDETAKTSLHDEHLLNEEGHLELHKLFDCAASRIATKHVAIAHHPSIENANDLLTLTNAQLKARLKTFDVDQPSVNQSVNTSMRRAIWSSIGYNELQLTTQEISLDKTSGKTILGKLQRHLPFYALFRADRPSNDADAEVQDPMKLAVKEAIAAVEEELEEIKAEVKRRAEEVAEQTRRKLHEMSPELAQELKPVFSTEPKWDGFKLSLIDEQGIPVNKRGSGVRRLILLNFFRAQAERRASESDSRDIIYAIEEPEVSQHPENQEMLINALLNLATSNGKQVILTTHVPRLAGLLPPKSIRHVSRDEHRHPIVAGNSEDVLSKVAEELGVLPSIEKLEKTRNQLRLLVCVEGPRDVAFLEHICKLLRMENDEIPDLAVDPRIVVMPLYGSSLLQWVESHYFRNTSILELHIYDRDAEEKYKEAYSEVNNRDDKSVAFFTKKTCIENYFHVELINETFDLQLSEDDIAVHESDLMDVIVKEVKRKPKNNTIRERIRAGSDPRKWRDNAKYYLHEESLPRMTLDHLKRVDAYNEFRSWFATINCLIATNTQD